MKSKIAEFWTENTHEISELLQLDLPQTEVITQDIK
jgi:hypothetical protein